jgi:hypothetical protein
VENARLQEEVGGQAAAGISGVIGIPQLWDLKPCMLLDGGVERPGSCTEHSRLTYAAIKSGNLDMLKLILEEKPDDANGLGY